MESTKQTNLNLYFDLLRNNNDKFIFLYIYDDDESKIEINTKYELYVKSLSKINFKNNGYLFLSFIDNDIVLLFDNKLNILNESKIFVSQNYYNEFKKYDFIYPLSSYRNIYSINKQRNLYDLINKNPALFLYSVSQDALVHNEKILPLLINNKILTTNNNSLEFTRAGMLFFEQDCNIKREIIVRNINDTRYRQYVEDFKKIDPLYTSIRETALYIDSKIPTIQRRDGFHNTRSKPFDAYSISKILTFMASYSNIDNYFKLEVNIYKGGIEFITPSNFEKNSLSKILKEEYSCPTLKELEEFEERDNIKIDIKRSSGQMIINTFYAVREDFLINNKIDDTDYRILSFARDINRPFRRSELEDNMLISSRTLQIRLMRLVDMGYINIIGTGRATQYELNRDKKSNLYYSGFYS